MIRHIIKKQGLIFWRTPSELILLLALPMLLIVILSFSLGSFFNSNEINLDVKIGWIDKGDEDKQLETFGELLQERQVPKEEQQAILEAAEGFNLVEIFREDVLVEMKDMITMEVLEPAEKEHALKGNDFTAIIEIPDDFLLKTWQYTLMSEGEKAAWQVEYDTEAGTDESVLREVIDKFQEQVTLSQYAMEEGENPETPFTSSDRFGTETTLDGDLVVETKDYYTIGMAVMNVLFMASAVSSFAFMEKEMHIFNRIILANITGRTYFSGVFIATTLFAFLQLIIIFAFSRFVFSVTWPDIVLFLTITFALACTVGGLAVILSMIAYRINSETIINMFGSIIVSVLAFLGGSFFPIGDFSEAIQLLGNYTPNGAAMTAYLEVLKGNDGLSVWKHVYVLVGFSVLLLGIAVGLYPKRGQQG